MEGEAGAGRLGRLSGGFGGGESEFLDRFGGEIVAHVFHGLALPLVNFIFKHSAQVDRIFLLPHSS